MERRRRPDVRLATGTPGEPCRADSARRFASAALAGGVYTLPFVDHRFWPLAFFALLPLLYALRGQSWQRASLLGAVTGLCTASCALYWVIPTLQRFAGLGHASAFTCFALLVGVQAISFAAMGATHVALRRCGWPLLLSFPTAVVLSEALVPKIFPFQLGASLEPAALIQVADIAGPSTISFGVSLVTACIWQMATDRVLRPAAVLAGALCVWLGYGFYRIHAIDGAVTDAPSLRVAVVQSDIDPVRREPGTALARHRSLTADHVAPNETDLVIWSETAADVSVHERHALYWYQEHVTGALDVPLLFGATLTGDNGSYNSALISDRRGDLVGRYDKQVLLPIGEYLPFRDYLSPLGRHLPRVRDLTPGLEDPALPIGPHEAAVVICYEDLFPARVNDWLRAGDAKLLVNMTNDGWFGDSIAARLHFNLSRLRAVEQRMYFIRAANDGVTAVVDPTGRIGAEIPVGTQGVLQTSVRLVRRPTLFRVVGFAPWWALGFVVLISFAARAWRDLRNREDRSIGSDYARLRAIG